MERDSLPDQRLLARCLAGSVLLLILAGCTFRPDLLATESVRIGDEEVVTVSLRAADAAQIKSRELYFSVVVFDCEGSRAEFPAESSVGNERASGFSFPVSGETVRILARVPTSIYDGYTKPCVFLRGGSYLFRKIESAAAPIEATGSGPD